MNKEVIVFPRGQLTKLDKGRLTKAGIVAIEADDPSLVKRLGLSTPETFSQSVINGDALITAALRALAPEEDAAGYPATRNRSRFVTLLAESIKDKS